jgi:hypothetical protein
MLFLRHVVWMLCDLFGYAKTHKEWWIVPVVLFLLLIGVLIVATEVVTPFIYTLF